MPRKNFGNPSDSFFAISIFKLILKLKSEIKSEEKARRLKLKQNKLMETSEEVSKIKERYLGTELRIQY